ncbi:hypothetical protein [Paenibacillus sp. RC84]|uniref:hypothetical protein n=1 Tax=Paenibacillus sp. RC84 TaxID=3156252 RepID=UPI003513D796
MQRLRHRESKATGEPREAAPSASAKPGEFTKRALLNGRIDLTLPALGKGGVVCTAVTHMPRAVRSGRRQADRAVRRPFAAAAVCRRLFPYARLPYVRPPVFRASLRLLYREQS